MKLGECWAGGLNLLDKKALNLAPFMSRAVPATRNRVVLIPVVVPVGVQVDLAVVAIPVQDWHVLPVRVTGKHFTATCLPPSPDPDVSKSCLFCGILLIPNK